MYLEAALVQTQQLKLNTKLVQGLELLQMSTVELTAYLEKQAEDNPLMELTLYPGPSRVGRAKGSRQASSESASNDWLLQSIAEQEDTLERTLTSQLRLSGLSAQACRLAAWIAGSLDDSGYLAVSLEELAGQAKRPVRELEAALAHVQALEPPGVGARSLRECLLLQIRRDPNADAWAARIADGHLPAVAAGKYTAIAEALGLSVEAVKASVQYIRTLNPRPGLACGQRTEAGVEPDARVWIADGKVQIRMNEASYPKVSLDDGYLRLRRESGCEQTKRFVSRYVPQVQWLIRSLERRRATISRVIAAVMEAQRPFLESSGEPLLPLDLKAVSEEVGLDPSTVSRAVKHKFVQTPRGVYPLKFFFSGKLPSRLEPEAFVSSHSIKARILQLVREEDKSKPLSDQQLTDALVRQGIQISRRTVMKYREAMHILSSRYRST